MRNVRFFLNIGAFFVSLEKLEGKQSVRLMARFHGFCRAGQKDEAWSLRRLDARRPTAVCRPRDASVAILLHRSPRTYIGRRWSGRAHEVMNVQRQQHARLHATTTYVLVTVLYRKSRRVRIASSHTEVALHLFKAKFARRPISMLVFALLYLLEDTTEL